MAWARRLAVGVVLAAVAAPATARRAPAAELPRPAYANCFFLEAGIHFAKGREAQRRELQAFYEAVGPQRLYIRVSCKPGGNDGPLQDADYRALGMWHGYYGTVILGRARTQLVADDARAMQWLHDGRAAFKDPDEPGPPFYTLSRYADAVWTQMHTDALREGRHFKGMLDRNAPVSVLAIPNELTYWFHGDAGAGYSPFMVAEFRDWLTWRGRYAPGGPYDGQGHPAGRAFADDPSPGSAKGRNRPFNAVYGTRFATWALKYWDLDAFPDALPTDAACMPAPGAPGYTPGGFDAPREPRDPLMRVWHDLDAAHPGFRQVALQRALAMVFHTLHAECGIPRDRLFTRHKDTTHVKYAGFQSKRPMKAVMPPWTACTPDGNPAFNCYKTHGVPDWVTDSVHRCLEAQRPPHWAVAEFHPFSSSATEHTAEEYEAELRKWWDCHTPGPRYLGCMKWNGGPKYKGKYQIQDTPFVAGLQRFARSLPDVPEPWRKRPRTPRYRPPAVRGVTAEADGRYWKVAWDARIWNGDVIRWSDWGDFARFEVAACATLEDDGTPAQVWRLGKSRTAQARVRVKEGAQHLLVRAVSRGRKEGAWTAVAVP